MRVWRGWGAGGGGDGGVRRKKCGGEPCLEIEKRVRGPVGPRLKRETKGAHARQKFARASHLILILTRETADLWGLTPAVVIKVR